MRVKLEITPAISSMVGEAAAAMGVSFDTFCSYAIFRTAEAVLIERAKSTEVTEVARIEAETKP
jgi:uncharacterized protein (DUF1778 family)